ncbi:MAG: hypothetical protein JXA54_08885 [Candidatus Heimdallarchaeota archaeon]|nr:hypothetical protein [Candidatus Heimdallarchaeota archaeon]
MIPEDVRKVEMLITQKRSLRTKAEEKKKSAHEKFKIGDYIAAKNDLVDARHYIQEALKLVRTLGERGISERTIQDDIEALWRRINSEESP